MHLTSTRMLVLEPALPAARFPQSQSSWLEKPVGNCVWREKATWLHLIGILGCTQTVNPLAESCSLQTCLPSSFKVKFVVLMEQRSFSICIYTHLNQIPYDYTVEVRNRFKGLDLIECLMNYGIRFMTLYRRQGSRPSPWKRNAKKQNGCLGRPYK